MAHLVLPVRLKIWQKAEPILNVIKTANGNEISNIEIPGAKPGTFVYAIEDGILVADQWALDHNAAELIGDRLEERIWNYRHIRVTAPDGPVQAGDKIGEVFGGNLILGVMDKDSAEERVPADKGAKSTWDSIWDSLGALPSLPETWEDFAADWDDLFSDAAPEDGTTLQILSRDPREVMDAEDILPLREDVDASVDTDEERHELSESLFGRGGFKLNLRTAIGVGIAGLAGYGLYKAFK